MTTPQVSSQRHMAANPQTERYFEPKYSMPKYSAPGYSAPKAPNFSAPKSSGGGHSGKTSHKH
jgi:hypothetical protein